MYLFIFKETFGYFLLARVLHTKDTYYADIYWVCQSVQHTRGHPNSLSQGRCLAEPCLKNIIL